MTSLRVLYWSGFASRKRLHSGGMRRQRSRVMSVLMSDVARKSGVSITTVSHVLNETRPVAEKTRERVLRAAAELNYYKNTSARLLVRGRSDLLGLIISDVENPFYPELIKSFERLAQPSAWKCCCARPITTGAKRRMRCAGCLRTGCRAWR